VDVGGNGDYTDRCVWSKTVGDGYVLYHPTHLAWDYQYFVDPKGNDVAIQNLATSSDACEVKAANEELEACRAQNCGKVEMFCDHKDGDVLNALGQVVDTYENDERYQLGGHFKRWDFFADAARRITMLRAARVPENYNYDGNTKLLKLDISRTAN
jgi:hypothetical protein